MYFGGNSFDVTLSDGVVETVYSGQDMLYPEAVKHNVLMDYDPIVTDLKSGNGDVVGQRAHIRIMKSQLEEITEENFREFAESVVKDSGYNWVSIICDDGTGICFTGSNTIHADYGTIDDDGTVPAPFGSIDLTEGGTYVYTEN